MISKYRPKLKNIFETPVGHPTAETQMPALPSATKIISADKNASFYDDVFGFSEDEADCDEKIDNGSVDHESLPAESGLKAACNQVCGTDQNKSTDSCSSVDNGISIDSCRPIDHDRNRLHTDAGQIDTANRLINVENRSVRIPGQKVQQMQQKLVDSDQKSNLRQLANGNQNSSRLIKTDQTDTVARDHQINIRSNKSDSDQHECNRFISKSETDHRLINTDQGGNDRQIRDRKRTDDANQQEKQTDINITPFDHKASSIDHKRNQLINQIRSGKSINLKSTNGIIVLPPKSISDSKLKISNQATNKGIGHIGRIIDGSQSRKLVAVTTPKPPSNFTCFQTLPNRKPSIQTPKSGFSMSNSFSAGAKNRSDSKSPSTGIDIDQNLETFGRVRQLREIFATLPNPTGVLKNDHTTNDHESIDQKLPNQHDTRDSQKGVQNDCMNNLQKRSDQFENHNGTAIEISQPSKTGIDHGSLSKLMPVVPRADVIEMKLQSSMDTRKHQASSSIKSINSDRSNGVADAVPKSNFVPKATFMPKSQPPPLPKKAKGLNVPDSIHVTANGLETCQVSSSSISRQIELDTRTSNTDTSSNWEIAQKQREEAVMLSDYVWFHADIDRRVAEARLLQYNKDGGFLIRYKSTPCNDSPYSLSVIQNGKIYHLQIRRKPNGAYALGDSKQDELDFSQLHEVVLYHRRHPLQLIRRKSGELAGLALLTSSPSK